MEFLIILAGIVSSEMAIYLIKKHYPKLNEELGKPPAMWNGTQKMVFLFGFILPFRFINTTRGLTRAICSFLAFLLWFLIIFAVYKFTLLL